MDSFEFAALKIRENIDKMDMQRMYVVGVDKDKLWETYLDSFPEGINQLYRKRKYYDCSLCRQFIKNLGNVVQIKDGKVTSIWDVDDLDEEFTVVFKALNDLVINASIVDVYVPIQRKIGTECNYETLDDGTIIKHPHFSYTISNEYSIWRKEDANSRMSEIRSGKEVFQRGLEELTMDALDTVIELSESKTLYKGEEWLSTLRDFKQYKKEYEALASDRDKDLYVWERITGIPPVIARLRNHSIGTLLVNLSEGMELEDAVKKYEAVVAPSNYKRPKALFTKKQVEMARQTVEELGYSDSLGRRFATLDDITANNILFVNRDCADRVEGASSIFDKLSKKADVTPKKFDKAQTISIDDFIANVLPNVSSVEAYVEYKHCPNFVSLIAPQNKNGKSMLKWNNNFSWAYNGNIADSMKQQVKKMGGNVDGVLRFSIRWNTGEYNPNDFDAHCLTPGGGHVYYSHKRDWTTGINLDVDIVHPEKGIPAVENIAFPNFKSLTDGQYKLIVHCFSNRGGTDGFEAEIEFDGRTYHYEYRHPMRTNEYITVAYVTYKDGKFSIQHVLEPTEGSSGGMWGVKLYDFAPVSVIMYSPNYWDDQHGIGNKHYMFMLKDAVNPDTPNGFYNEFLDSRLMKHKRVFEALGNEMKVSSTENQLSGLGFSSTQRNSLTVRTKGNTERVFNIVF